MYVFFVLIDIGIQVRLPLVDLSFSLYIKLININKKIKHTCNLQLDFTGSELVVFWLVFSPPEMSSN